VKKFLRDAVAKETVAGGSLLLLHHGKVIFGEGFGFADIETKRPFRLDTPVVVASISKPLMGTAAFRLAERGKVNLQEPVSRYLPEFKTPSLESGKSLERAPTMAELFTHSAGLRADDSPGGRPWFSSWIAGKSLEEAVGRFAKELPFKSPPGTRYAYSGVGTDIAARVLEVVSEKARNELFLAEVAKPLGMKRTTFRDARGLEMIGAMPSRYYRAKDGGLLKSRGKKVPPTNTYSSSGGTIISTSPDLARWLQMFRNEGRHEDGEFLAPGTVARMLSGQTKSRNAKGGLFIRKKNEAGKVLVWGHTGSSGTNCWIDGENDLIGIMLTQTRGRDIKPFRIQLEKLVTECVTKAK
jgi:CubicO group peptidase (beta-lactamase class C family)